MAKRFENLIVMITGAGGGFGAVAARRFAQEGASLLMCDIDKKALDKSVDQLPKNTAMYSERIDITNFCEVSSFLESGEKSLGPLDIAINNAGIGQVLSSIDQTSEEVFDDIMAVNVKGVFNCMKVQVPRLVSRKDAAILNIASAAGLVGAGHMAAYAASKHAVVGLTRSVADEVARHNIRVNALCPSFSPTNLFNEMADDLAMKNGESRHAIYDRVTGRIPMRRVASIDEIVQAMLWAVSPENSFMTGQAISIDGGLTAV